MPTSGQRKLAAIMFTDIVGYTSVMQEDEARGKMLRTRHRSVFDHATAKHGGKVIQYFGDGTLSIFDSAVSAVECAIDMQQQLKTYPHVPLRIGIHLGDIHYDETEVYGHGVNVAARIEPVCNPGGVFISQKVYDEIENHPYIKASSLGKFRFKNMERELELFAIQNKDVSFPTTEDISMIAERSNKVRFAGAAARSEAIRRFSRESRNRRYTSAARWLALVAVLVVAGVAFSKLTSAELPGKKDDRMSIAVLPFVNMSPSSDNDYFSDGMTEDILTLLSRIEGFSVTSRTSVMQYKNTNKTTRQIARELDVDRILEGSVRRDGDKVRVTAQLIDTEDDSHIWAHTYDEDLTNIFSVQSQVAEDISRQLKETLTESDISVFDEQRVVDITAYDLYLRGRQFYRQYTEQSNERAIDFFNSALEIEPNLAYAYAGLGDAYAQKAFKHDMDKTILDTAIRMSERAIEVNPSLSDGYKALGLAFHYKGDYDNAIQQYEKALKLNPNNDMAASNLGQIQKERGNIKEAAFWANHSYDINKNLPTSALNLIEIYMTIGDFEEAERITDDALSVNPESSDLNFLKGHLRLVRGDIDGARRYAEIHQYNQPEAWYGYELLAMIDMMNGEWEEAIENYERGIGYVNKPHEKLLMQIQRDYARSREGSMALDQAYIDSMFTVIDSVDRVTEHYRSYIEVAEAGLYAIAGQKAEFFSSLDEAIESGWTNLNLIEWHPIFQSMRDEPEMARSESRVESRMDSLRKEVDRALTPKLDS